MYIGFDKNKVDQKNLNDQNNDKELLKMAEVELDDLKIQHLRSEKNENYFYCLKIS